jgi:hypothetical protein
MLGNGVHFDCWRFFARLAALRFFASIRAFRCALHRRYWRCVQMSRNKIVASHDSLRANTNAATRREGALGVKMLSSLASIGEMLGNAQFIDFYGRRA